MGVGLLSSTSFELRWRGQLCHPQAAVKLMTASMGKTVQHRPRAPLPQFAMVLLKYIYKRQQRYASIPADGTASKRRRQPATHLLVAHAEQCYVPVQTDLAWQTAIEARHFSCYLDLAA